jgi:acyl carrier protein
MNALTDRVLRLLAHRCEVPGEGVNEETELSSLDLDSLTLLEFSFDLEKEFGGVDDGAVARARTVGDLVRAVRVPAA